MQQIDESSNFVMEGLSELRFLKGKLPVPSPSEKLPKTKFPVKQNMDISYPDLCPDIAYQNASTDRFLELPKPRTQVIKPFRSQVYLTKEEKILIVQQRAGKIKKDTKLMEDIPSRHIQRNVKFGSTQTNQYFRNSRDVTYQADDFDLHDSKFHRTIDEGITNVVNSKVASWRAAQYSALAALHAEVVTGKMLLRLNGMKSQNFIRQVTKMRLDRNKCQFLWNNLINHK